MSRHNHADAWPCNSSCPVHPDYSSYMNETFVEESNIARLMVASQPDPVTTTKNYKILSVRPPSNERELFPQYWLFDVEGPGVNKTYIGTTEQCGSQFIRALQGAYDAGCLFGDQRVLDSVRASVLGYPNSGGDEVIMKKIKIIELKAELRGREAVIKSLENVGKGIA